jgi:hypothetical protein
MLIRDWAWYSRYCFTAAHAADHLEQFLARTPHQFVFMLICTAGCPRIAGVHLTVWIFAMSAQLINRAVSKIFCGFQCG